MSFANSSTHNSSRRSVHAPAGISLWSGIAIVVAGLLTGAIISLVIADLGWPFLLCFALSALVATVLVEIRGLFLTVACQPLGFGIVTVVTSWLLTRSAAAAGTSPFSKTALLTSGFPLLELFPGLIATTAAMIIIGALRYWRAVHSASRAQEQAIITRRATAEADRHNRDVATRARQRSGSLTVAELTERTAARRNTDRSPDRDFSGQTSSGQASSSSTSSGRTRAAHAAHSDASPVAHRHAAESQETGSPYRPNPDYRAGQDNRPSQDDRAGQDRHARDEIGRPSYPGESSRPVQSPRSRQDNLYDD